MKPLRYLKRVYWDMHWLDAPTWAVVAPFALLLLVMLVGAALIMAIK